VCSVLLEALVGDLLVALVALAVNFVALGTPEPLLKALFALLVDLFLLLPTVCFPTALIVSTCRCTLLALLMVYQSEGVQPLCKSDWYMRLFLMQKLKRRLAKVLPVYPNVRP
jgi:hypothetical protein